MRVMRLFRHDMRNGWLLSFPFVLISAILAAFILFGSYASGADWGIDASSFSLGDNIAYLLGGSAEYMYRAGLPFTPPVAWLLLIALMCACTLAFPYRDLMGPGRLHLIAVGRRRRWWAAMCFWVGATLTLFWAVILGACLVKTLVDGSRLSLVVHPSALIAAQADSSMLADSPVDGSMLVSCFIVMGFALSYLQLFLSFFIGPTQSFVCLLAVYIASAYKQSPLLVGNYLMADRWGGLVAGGVDSGWGLVLGGVIIAVSVVLGGLYFKRFDVLDKELNV